VVGAAEAVLEAAPAEAEVEAPAEAEEAGPVVLGERPKLRDRLGRARGVFGEYLGSLRTRGKIDDSTWEDLEELLILADAGLPTTTKILDDLRARAKAGTLSDPESVVTALKEDLVAMFDGEDRQLRIAGVESSPDVWLFVGVNGVGKTTTIGKVAAREAAAGRKVVLAAGDTFRAAAGEQLEVWAERSGGRLIRGSDGADPSSVIFDAVQHAASKGADLVLADTAGRLHTKVNLMEELRKVRRVAERPPAQLTEVLLVLDATTGQNGLVQAREFSEAAGVTGVVLTKLDGTAKGGIVLAIRSELGLPIKLVGVGEHIEDLVEFDPVEFVEGLLAE
jgi:fused signal recognition particle receptor